MTIAVSAQTSRIVGSLPLGPARSRPALAASEPPRGRILVVEGRAQVGLDLQRALREGGWRVVGPATSTADVRLLIGRGPLDAAVVDLDGVNEGAADIPDLLEKAGVPFMLLVASRDRIPARHRRHPAIGKPYFPSEVLATLERTIPKNPSARPVTAGSTSWARTLPLLQGPG